MEVYGYLLLTSSMEKIGKRKTCLFTISLTLSRLPAFKLQLVKEAAMNAIILKDRSLRALPSTDDFGTYQRAGNIPWGHLQQVMRNSRDMRRILIE